MNTNIKIKNMKNEKLEWMYQAKSDTLQKRLFADLDSKIFTDVAFFVGKDENQRAFDVHKLVLAAENSEFEKLLYGKDNVDKIELPDLWPNGFENLIRYCYGESLRYKDLTAIRETYQAAEKFKAQKLNKVLENYLIEHVKSEPVVELLKVSVELNMPMLKERCLEIISARFEKVLMMEGFISASREIIEPVLSLWSEHGLEFKICIMATLFGWAKNQPLDADIHSLLSMVQVDDVKSSDIAPFLESKRGQLTDYQSQAVQNCLSPEFSFFIKDFFLKSTNATDASVSYEDTITSKDETSKEKQNNLLKEKVSECKAKATEPKSEIYEVSKSDTEDDSEDERVTGRNLIREVVKYEESECKAKATELENEVSKSYIEDSDDEKVMGAKIIQEVLQDAEKVLKCGISASARDTLVDLTDAADEALNHASEILQKAFENFFTVDSHRYVFGSSPKERQIKENST